MIASFSGSRDFTNYEYVSNVIKHYLPYITKIHVGDAKGVDSLVVRFCSENNINYQIFKADWNKYGKGAGPIRNRELINGTSILIAFPSNNSKGTISAINIANELNINVHIYNI